MAGLFDLDNVSWSRQSHSILHRINWSIAEGEHWVLMGPNGCGKSSLLSILCMEEWPTTGSLRLFGNEVRGNPVAPVKRRLGLFNPRQAEELAHNYPSITALDLLLFGLKGALPYYTEVSESERSNATSILARHPDLAIDPETRVASMSSGERRRIAFLKTVVHDPEILFLDEPYENLDIAARLALEAMLWRQADVIRGSVTVVHRIEDIPPFITHAALMNKGEILRKGPAAEILTSENVTIVYGVPLEVRKSGASYFWKAAG